jgi:hypothetical protein
LWHFCESAVQMFYYFELALQKSVARFFWGGVCVCVCVCVCVRKSLSMDSLLLSKT